MTGKKELLKELEILSNAFGPSGFEEEVIQKIAELSDTLHCENDAMNDLYMTENGTIRHDRPVFMLDAHLDECGFMIQSIEDNGLMQFVMLGGWHMSAVPAHSVIIRTSSGRKVRGIITSKPVHFMSAKERADTSLEIEKHYIDVGCSSRQEVIDTFGIMPGDPVMPDVTFSYDEDSDICFGKAFDNRVGCLCIMETMRRLQKIGFDKLDTEPVGAFASQEEVGERGAAVTAVRVKPDFAIVFEGSPSDDGYVPQNRAQGSLRKGVQIRHFDRSYISNPRFIQYAMERADEKGIKYQNAVRRGGGTNAGILHNKTDAVPVLVLGVPCRYVHTHYNFCAPEDIESAVSMAVEVITGLNSEKQAYILGKNILKRD